MFVNFSHLCTRWGMLPGRSCLDPTFSPSAYHPLVPSPRLSSLPYGAAMLSRRLSRLPDHNTGLTLGETCGEVAVNQWAPPVFADIHLHMSRPRANQKPCMSIWLWGDKRMQLPCGDLHVTHLLSRQIRLYHPQTHFISITYQMSLHFFARFALCTLI